MSSHSSNLFCSNSQILKISLLHLTNNPQDISDHFVLKINKKLASIYQLSDKIIVKRNWHIKAWRRSRQILPAVPLSWKLTHWDLSKMTFSLFSRVLWLIMYVSKRVIRARLEIKAFKFEKKCLKPANALLLHHPPFLHFRLTSQLSMLQYFHRLNTCRIQYKIISELGEILLLLPVMFYSPNSFI